jgi:hypothetical protein
VAAARLALEDAKLDTSSLNAERIGVIVGSAFGGMESYERETLKLDKFGPKKVGTETERSPFGERPQPAVQSFPIVAFHFLLLLLLTPATTRWAPSRFRRC